MHQGPLETVGGCPQDAWIAISVPRRSIGFRYRRPMARGSRSPSASPARARASIDVAERRRRLVARHAIHPATRVARFEDAARAVVALHSTDPVTVVLAAWARLQDPAVPDMERALYEERTVLRMHGMRRTLFVAPLDTAAVIQSAVTDSLGTAERARNVKLLAGAGIGGDDPGGWLREVEDEALRALATLGEAPATELGRAVPRMREQIALAEGKSYAAQIGAGTRVLLQLGMDGRIARGRPLGTWIASQYRWLPIERVCPGGIPRLDPRAARAELVRLWLERFGPGTMADLRWWTGLTAGAIRTALADADAEEVTLVAEDGSTVGDAGFVVAGDVETTKPLEPAAAVLPALDSTPMGWTARDWYLGAHRPTLFDPNGNVGPTVWWDGRIVGGWAQRRSGEIAVRLLEDVGPEASSAIAAEAARLEAWLGPVRATPRFRTPLERELAG
jgi:winged helix DNA-binding protein